MDQNLLLTLEDKNIIKTSIALIKDDNYCCHYIGKWFLSKEINKIIHKLENDFDIDKYAEEFKNNNPNLENDNYRLSHINIIRKCEVIKKKYNL